MLPLTWIEPPFLSIPVSSPVTIHTTPSRLPWFVPTMKVIISVQQFREWSMRTSKRTDWVCLCRRFSLNVMQRTPKQERNKFHGLMKPAAVRINSLCTAKPADVSYTIIILPEIHSFYRNDSNNSHLIVYPYKKFIINRWLNTAQ